jgi:hypothetical protein
MEEGSISTHIYSIFKEIDDYTSVSDALIHYTRRLEREYSISQDIVLFIFGFRIFFCWHRAEELLDSPDDIRKIEAAWIEQNDDIYTEWLSSPDDRADSIRWEKWTFQAKTTIFNEFLQSFRRVGGHKPFHKVTKASYPK